MQYEEAQNQTATFALSTTFVEIYNDHVYDLYKPENVQRLDVRMASHRHVFVDKATHRSAQTSAEAISAWCEGVRNRTTAETAMNR